MPFIDRREFLKIMGISAAATTVPGLVACGKGAEAVSAPAAGKSAALAATGATGGFL